MRIVVSSHYSLELKKHVEVEVEVEVEGRVVFGFHF